MTRASPWRRARPGTVRGAVTRGFPFPAVRVGANLASVTHGSPVRQPDLFIVGAPKSGTTALHTHLGGHPQIFLPAQKDRPFFGSDLEFRRWRLSREEYEADLRGGADAPIRGHSCVWYLYSRRAAQEIHRAAPSARIVIMLRNPVDMLHAQHSQFLYNGNEDIADFGEALAAEPARRSGRRVPRRAHFVQGLWYLDTARFGEQVERYLRVFGDDQVTTVLYDDFRADPEGTVASIARWVGADAVPLPGGVVNANKRVRSRRLQSFLMSPPPWLERGVHAVLPGSLHGRIAPWMIRRNVQETPRGPVPSALRRRIVAELADDTSHLGELLGRDLSGWCGDARSDDGQRVGASRARA
jgi:hypothetical protein